MNVLNQFSVVLDACIIEIRLSLNFCVNHARMFLQCEHVVDDNISLIQDTPREVISTLLWGQALDSFKLGHCKEPRVENTFVPDITNIRKDLFRGTAQALLLIKRVQR